MKSQLRRLMIHKRLVEESMEILNSVGGECADSEDVEKVFGDIISLVGGCD